MNFGDLPKEVREKLWKHPNAKPSFTLKSNGEVTWNIDPGLPEATLESVGARPDEENDDT